MNKCVFVLLIILIPGSLSAQKTLTIKGNIQNPAEPVIMLHVPDPALPASPREMLIDTLNARGEFAIALSISKPVFALLQHERFFTDVYLEPGKDLAISLNTENPGESLKFKGPNAVENQFLSHYLIKFERDNPRLKIMKSSQPKEFMIYAAEQRKEKEEFLTNYSTSLPANFYNLMKQKIAYEWGTDLLTYPWAYGQLNNTEEPELTSDYFSYELVLPLSNPLALDLLNYQDYVFHKTQDLFDRSLKKQGTTIEGKDYINRMYAFAESILKGEILEYYHYKFLFEGMSRDGLNNYIDAYQKFIASSSNKAYKNSLAAEYQRLFPLITGSKAPDFQLKTIDGNVISLEKLKGQVVFIDFWASWCGPCLKESPFAKKLKDHFKNQPGVAFVYISLDEDESSWKAMVKKQGLEGIHLYSPGMNSQLAQAYAILEIPRYVLIDKKGNIVEANMTRPSDPATIKRIEAVLNKN